VTDGGIHHAAMRGFEAGGWTRMLDDAGYAKAPLRAAPAR